MQLDTNNIPQHIAIIMDGNGRWAAERGKPRSFGHQAGVDTVRRITSECTRLGVKYLTLYTFSTENWNRPATEVAALMGLVLTSLEDEIFMKNNVRFRVIGDLNRLPIEVQQKLHETEEYQERTGIDLMHLCFEQLTGNQIRSLSATFLVMAAHHSLNLDASLSLPNE